MTSNPARVYHPCTVPRSLQSTNSAPPPRPAPRPASHSPDPATPTTPKNLNIEKNPNHSNQRALRHNHRHDQEIDALFDTGRRSAPNTTLILLKRGTTALNQIHTMFPDKLPPTLLMKVPLLQNSAHDRIVGVTAAEALAWMAGDPHSENPPSICPVLLAAVRFWGRNLSQRARDNLLRPILPSLLDTGGDARTSTRRAQFFMAWTLMTNTSAWMDAAGRHEEAVLLRTTPSTNLYRVHKSLDSIIAATPFDPRVNPSPGATRAVLASGHFMPERYRSLQQKAQTTALAGAVATRQRGFKLGPLVRRLQASFAQHILSTVQHRQIT